jgi:hypothetical protein
MKATGKSFRKIKLHTFDKIDGSNLRFEWSRKKGWYKFGTRTRLFDHTDTVFGEAIKLFQDTLSENLAKIIVGEGWERAIVFCEFWGEQSFAGHHVIEEPKYLTVIDVAPYKKGMLDPVEFVKLFGEFGPKYLGKINWNRDFVEKVYDDRIDGVTFEGVVGKVTENKKTVMYKTKTKKWLDKVNAMYDEIRAAKIINS